MTFVATVQTSDSGIEARFVAALESVLPRKRPIALHEPFFGGKEWDYVKECIDTGWVSTVGKFVDEFERRLTEVTGSRYAIATVNGTAALHVSLKLAGVVPGDEVLVPALSFVATANAISHCGAIPHFVDSSDSTLGLDADALRNYLCAITEKSGGGLRNKITGRRLAAVVPMHAFGHPADIAGLLALSVDFGIPLVEDAAESLGSYYQGQHTGTFGMFGALSFNGNKIITTGGGGVILTQDAELARHAKHITTTAKRSHRWEFFHDEIAWNYRLPNINAALGCAQLERLEEFIVGKRALACKYRDVFAENTDVLFVEEPSNCRSNYWLSTVMLRDPSINIRDRLLDAANDAGLMVRPAWTLLNRLPMYSECPTASLHVAERLESALINLPSGPSIIIGNQA
jgi:perosamine synthetase